MKILTNRDIEINNIVQSWLQFIFVPAAVPLGSTGYSLPELTPGSVFAIFKMLKYSTSFLYRYQREPVLFLTIRKEKTTNFYNISRPLLQENYIKYGVYINPSSELYKLLQEPECTFTTLNVHSHSNSMSKSPIILRPGVVIKWTIPSFFMKRSVNLKNKLPESFVKYRRSIDTSNTEVTPITADTYDTDDFDDNDY